MMNLKMVTFNICNSLSIFLVFCLLSCSRKGSPVVKPSFEDLPVSSQLNPLINEISGIADSELEPGTIWGIEDSGNPTRLYAINHNAQVVKKVFLAGISNRDWEDLALANGDVYIAETGDNALQHADYTIYIFKEPGINTDTVSSIQKIRFKYPDGSNDCEAMIVDPASKDIFLFTKSSNGAKIYRLAFPYSEGPVHTVSLLGSKNINGIVSATQSPDQKEIILKTYSSLYYFPRNPGEGILQSLSRSPFIIPYSFEPQGEAVCFAADNSGYYTLSEKGFSNEVWLHYYKRK